MDPSWSDFLHLRSGRAMPYARVAALFETLPSPQRDGARKAGFSRVFGDDERALLAKYRTSAEPTCTAPMPLAWSEFVRIYGGDSGLSQWELLTLYEREKRAWTPIAPYPPPAPAPDQIVSSVCRDEPMVSQQDTPCADVIATRSCDESPNRSFAGRASRGEDQSSETCRSSNATSINTAVFVSAPPQMPPPPPPPPSGFGGVKFPTFGEPIARPSPPQPRTEQDPRRVVLASRAFKLCDDGTIARQDLLRVTDFNRNDVSSEEIAARFKAVLAVVKNGTPPNGPVAASPEAPNEWTSSVTASVACNKRDLTFRDSSEASRRFFDGNKKELSQEEVRAALYEFRTPQTEKVPLKAVTTKRSRRLVRASMFNPLSQEARIQHDPELFAAYPPSTEHLPSISMRSALRSAASSIPSGFSTRLAAADLTAVQTRREKSNARVVVPFATYPPSTEQLPCVSFLVRAFIHANDAVRFHHLRARLIELESEACSRLQKLALSKAIPFAT